MEFIYIIILHFIHRVVYGSYVSWNKEDWNAGFEFLIAVVMKSSIVWDMTSCSELQVNRR
jgi:hypothetical protein